MCNHVNTCLAPPSSPASIVGSGQLVSGGPALWQRYYGLYSAYLRHLSCGRGSGGGVLCNCGATQFASCTRGEIEYGRCFQSDDKLSEFKCRCEGGSVPSDVDALPTACLCQSEPGCVQCSSCGVDHGGSRMRTLPIVLDARLSSLDVGGGVCVSAQNSSSGQCLPLPSGGCGRSCGDIGVSESDNGAKPGNESEDCPSSELTNNFANVQSEVGVNKVFLPRGPNFERNHAMRMKKREKKLAEKKNLRQAKTSIDKPKEQKGFWNSCTEEERKLLISTKARMHAAENLRRAKEAEQRASEIGTSFDLASKVVKMVDFAEKQASKEGSSKVYAWASGVANSSAENLAKSVPSSAPSLTALDEKLAASSQSSFELEIMSKDVEIRTLKEKNEAAEDRIERLTDEIYDLKLASQMSDNRFSLLSIAKDRLNKQEKKQSGVTFLNKSLDKRPKFVKTPQQPFEYVKYSPLDYE